ncbi:Hypothetical predicted protein, partial [Paramuricea clavata]
TILNGNSMVAFRYLADDPLCHVIQLSKLSEIIDRGWGPTRVLNARKVYLNATQAISFLLSNSPQNLIDTLKGKINRPL